MEKYIKTRFEIIPPLSEIVNLSPKYPILCKGYTDEGGINRNIIVCPPVWGDNPRAFSSWIISSYKRTNSGVTSSYFFGVAR